MLFDPSMKYRHYETVDLPDRTWPNKKIEVAPIWCSVDLRDGNQALANPMNHERKMRFYELLCRIGFKQIEVGFPSASTTEFDFLRHLIEQDCVPEDITISVLTQARDPLIRRTFAAIKGAKNVIVHQYNSTSEVQRRLVFLKDRKGIIDIAVSGMALIRELAEKSGNASGVTYEYTAESFPGTELDFALEICNKVIETLEPTPEHKLIVNLPETVQLGSANVYADRIEWVSRQLDRRDSVILSVHTHNDRGTGVAAAELALMGGAERVEGTLFGNGERTGNVDLVTLALNMYSQGVPIGLNFSRLKEIREIVEYCNQITVHERHPYAGDLVYTAFSGSHQDAIKKGLQAQRSSNKTLWEVPYLPLDPADVGFDYKAIIRINSQSGKSGIAYVMEAEYGFKLPPALQVEFSDAIQGMTDALGCELSSEQIRDKFYELYIDQSGRRILLKDFRRFAIAEAQPEIVIEARIVDSGAEAVVRGNGDSLLTSFVDALSRHLGEALEVCDYSEQPIFQPEAAFVSYVQLQLADGEKRVGVGLGVDIAASSLAAVASAVNLVLSAVQCNTVPGW